ncbi:response regulator [Candidatus Omnitrophota bacterium]
MAQKILIIDDEKVFVDSLKTALESEGYIVVAANDGDEGIARAKNEKPDLIICDMRMPKKDGHEVLRAIKEGKDRWFPFIMLTAFGEFDSAKKAYDDECDLYLTKPVELPVLLHNIKTLLNLAKHTPKEKPD